MCAGLTETTAWVYLDSGMFHFFVLSFSPATSDAI